MPWKRLFPLALGIALAGCGGGEGQKIINGAGSSFVYPLLSKWTSDYSKATGIRINYQSIGSGGGIRQVSARTVDFGASDAPLTPRELDSLNLYQFPIIVGGVVPVLNVPGVEKGQMKLSTRVVCDIFLGKITRWNDPSLKELNPELNLPDMEITVVHRSDGSGTTWLWTNYLSKACPEWKEKVGYGKSVKWPTGIGAKGNEGVANYVKQNVGSIGYVEFAYAVQSNLVYALLENKAGNFVEPSINSFKAATANASWDPGTHFYQVLTWQDGKDSWPVVGAVFILLPREKKEVNRMILDFFGWAFDNGDDAAVSLYYVPLPMSIKELVRGYWKEVVLR